MAFRKRNIGVGRTPAALKANDVGLESAVAPSPVAELPGIRPSPLTGLPTTSTGTATLDTLLGGHAGLALGSTLLIEESGTTDFAGALLRYYAAQGLIQGHTLHIVGVGEQWVKELPAVVGPADAAIDRDGKRKDSADKAAQERMKIAWRYEHLGETASGRVLPDRGFPRPSSVAEAGEDAFCHSFDLAKRLGVPKDAIVHHVSINPTSPLTTPPFKRILDDVSQRLASSPPTSIHRLIIPTILSPALYPSHASNPQEFLQFLHALRALTRQYSTRLTAMISLPLELYPRKSGLIRWAEILCDGLVELTPFPHLMDASHSLAESGGARGTEEQPQGMVKIHKLPVNTERGEGGAASGMGEDLAFTVSRRKFVIKPFSLPPVEGDTVAQQGPAEGGKLTKVDVEF